MINASEAPTPLPMSFVEAQATCVKAALMLRTAGPAACKTAPADYAQTVLDLEQAGEVFGRIEERRRARLAKEQGATS